MPTYCTTSFVMTAPEFARVGVVERVADKCRRSEYVASVSGRRPAALFRGKAPVATIRRIVGQPHVGVATGGWRKERQDKATEGEGKKEKMPWLPWAS